MVRFDGVEMVERRYQGSKFEHSMEAKSPEDLDRRIRGLRRYARRHKLDRIQVLRKWEDEDGNFRAVVVAHNWNPIKWIKEKLSKRREREEEEGYQPTEREVRIERAHERARAIGEKGRAEKAQAFVEAVEATQAKERAARAAEEAAQRAPAIAERARRLREAQEAESVRVAEAKIPAEERGTRLKRAEEITAARKAEKAIRTAEYLAAHPVRAAVQEKAKELGKAGAGRMGRGIGKGFGAGFGLVGAHIKSRISPYAEKITEEVDPDTGEVIRRKVVKTPLRGAVKKGKGGMGDFGGIAQAALSVGKGMPSPALGVGGGGGFGNLEFLKQAVMPGGMKGLSLFPQIGQVGRMGTNGSMEKVLAALRGLPDETLQSRKALGQAIPAIATETDLSEAQVKRAIVQIAKDLKGGK